MNTKKLYNLFTRYPIISTDTRKIFPNSIFFALKGNNFDGNDFAADALEKGASCVVVDKKSVVKNDQYFLVDDVLSSLQSLSNYHRKKLAIPVIGITGTNGKTTTKELIHAVLSQKFHCTSTIGNLNNHIGVPLTLLKMNSKTEIGIVEMGANHPGEIHELCTICEPDFGIITNVGKAHLEGFGSFEGILKTKTELYRFIKKKKGKIFINSDNELLISAMPKGLMAFSYGNKPGVFLKGEIVNQTPYLNIKAWFQKGILFFNSKLIGNYNFENILAAICIGKYFEIDPLLIQKAVNNYHPENNRSQLIKTRKNTIIMDAYNANPTSMKASINNFISMEGNKKCLILGDMLELGNDSLSEHQMIVNLIQSNNFEKIFIIGNIFSETSCSKCISLFKNSSELCDYLDKEPISDSLILIKGSRGIQLEKTLKYL